MNVTLHELIAMAKIVHCGYHFNLLGQFPSNHTFDVIFLRNVMIYFDKPTQEKLVNKCYDNIEKDGYFFIGHSESLTGVKHKFKYIKPSVYRT